MTTTRGAAARAAPVAVPRWAAPVTLVLCLVGLGVSIYLTVVHYTEPRSLSCPDTGGINCVAVTTSEESMLFGVIPVAITGIPFFLVMGALCLPAAWRSPSTLLRNLRLAGSIAGVGMVVYLVYVELIQVRAICLWCTVAHVASFGLFVAVLAATVLRPVDHFSR